jgi:hypothetical protein
VLELRPGDELEDWPLEEPAALEEGAVGWKNVWPVPNPAFAAFVPPTVIMATLFLPLMTSLPLELSHAATYALP